MRPSINLYVSIFLGGFLFFFASPVAAQYAIPASKSGDADSIKVVSVETSEKDQQLKLNLNQPTPGDASISLFNLNGMEVQRRKLEEDKDLVEVDMAELPEGMYIAVISGKEMYVSQYVFKEF